MVGGPGSGKSTLARQVSQVLGLEYVEIDAMWWQADWVPAGRAELEQLLLARLGANERWVTDGNYIDVGALDIIVPGADTLVWLDLPRRTCMRRAVLRTACRIGRKQELWAGNRENVSNLAPRQLVRLWRRWPSYPRQIHELAASGACTHLFVVRLRSPRQVRTWIRAIRSGR